jgi:hypothetical protein
MTARQVSRTIIHHVTRLAVVGLVAGVLFPFRGDVSADAAGRAVFQFTNGLGMVRTVTYAEPHPFYLGGDVQGLVPLPYFLAPAVILATWIVMSLALKITPWLSFDRPQRTD